MLGSSAVLMLCTRYGYARGDALRLAGLWSAASYLVTVPGGFAIDRACCARFALSAGMTVLMLGYAALTCSGWTALCIALALLLVGHALLKPSCQAVIGSAYAQRDQRLDAAQILFYFAINAGGTVGAIGAGLFLRSHDFRALCGVSAAAMFAGCSVLAIGWSTLPIHQSQTTSIRTTSQVPRSTRQRIQIIAGATLAMMIYTVGFGQVEGSLLLWAQDRTDRVLFHFTIPASWFVGLPGLLVLVLAPVQLAVLPKLRARVRTHWLVGCGLALVCLAFAVLIPPMVWSGGHRVSMVWLFANLFLLTVGELLVAPLGLSMLLQVTPPRHVGIVISIWYVASALGYWLAGEVGRSCA